jgi:hypothetical protein
MISLNAYFDKCLKIITTFDDFTIHHVSSDENIVVDNLAQQASSFRSNRENLYVLEKSDVLVCHSGRSGLQQMHNAKICSVESSSLKLNVFELGTRGSGISCGLDDLGETTMAEPEDWRAHLVCYLENIGHVIDRKVWREALKYVLLNHDLYR